MSDPNPNPDPAPKDQDPEKANPPLDPDPNADPDDDEDPPAPTVESLQADLAKVTKAANRRDRELRKAQAELAALKGGASKDGDPKDPPAPDPVAKANRLLVAGAARVELASLGVAKEDHADVLEVLNLDGIDVDDNGEVDAEEITDRIERLRKAFGGAATKPPRPRTPKITPRDQGGANGDPVDPDAARFRRILGRRG